MGKTRRQDTVGAAYKDTIQKLKASCRELQKELARLRKELGRREDVSEDYKELLNEAPPLTPANPEPRCPKCNAGIDTTPIGKFLLIKCMSCDWRVRKEA